MAETNVIDAGRRLIIALRCYGFPVSTAARPALVDHGSDEAFELDEAARAFAVAIEQQDQIIAGLLEAIEPFAEAVHKIEMSTSEDALRSDFCHWPASYSECVKARAARDNARTLSEAASKARAALSPDAGQPAEEK